MPEITLHKPLFGKANRFFLLIAVPVLGIIIPAVSGLLENIFFDWWQYLLSFACFILISYTVCQGNVFLLQRFRKSDHEYVKGYYKMLLLYLVINIAYTGIVTFLLLAAWHLLFQLTINWHNIFTTALMVIFLVVLINTFYEIIFIRQEMEDSMLKVKLLEMEKIQAELSALKSQIDPHFMFNSLNTLSYLISNKPDTAKSYNDTLAKVYRYILVYKDQNLVFLKEELEFVSNYFYLINIRYEQAVRLLIEIPDVKAENFLVIPASLQVLIENAIKHNDFSQKEPLSIHIYIQANHVTVKNLIRPKLFAEPTSGIGLENLKERSRLITGKNIILNRDNGEFIVKVPLLKS